MHDASKILDTRPAPAKLGETSAAHGLILPMPLGVVLLWGLFYAGLIIWWMLMVAFFREEAYLQAVVIAYALPILYMLAAFLGSKIHSDAAKLLHFGTFAFLGFVFAGLLLEMGEQTPLDDPSPYLGIAFIAFVMSLMQYPRAGLRKYDAYRSSLFIGGVVFMPLFIFIAALLPNVPDPPALDKAYLLPIGLLGFWLSAAWLGLRATHGKHVSGLEIRPLFPFRPDFILPGGVNYVKGAIMMGIGLMIAIHPKLGMPKWNWWGFVLAFWGIITLIPLRGMYKMAKSRRLRMLGIGGTGFGHEVGKGLILFIGLIILVYGFINAFFGTVPFSVLGVEPEFNTFVSGTTAGQLVSVITFILAFLVLVPLRGKYKIDLNEGIETTRENFLKQFMLWGGTLLLFVSFIHLFNLPPIRGTGVLGIYPNENPVGFVIGLILFLAGSVLIMILRPIALQHELEAIINSMLGLMSDQPDPTQRWMLRNRIGALAVMPEKQRDLHFAWMYSGLSALPEKERQKVMAMQMLVLAQLDTKSRRRCMLSMDKAMLGAT